MGEDGAGRRLQGTETDPMASLLGGGQVVRNSPVGCFHRKSQLQEDCGGVERYVKQLTGDEKTRNVKRF